MLVFHEKRERIRLQAITYTLVPVNNSFNQCRSTLGERAGRSVVDRFLGMEEAAGSIPAQSMVLTFLS